MSLQLSGIAICLALTINICQAGDVNKITDKQCQAMKNAQVISDQAPVNCSRLRLVTFNYVNFKGQQHNNGEIVVLDAVADQVAALFDRLQAMNFPIHQARPMEHFNGSDDASMAANNTSAFIDRPITGQKKTISLHAYGLAIDINPVQNPYLSFPEEGKAEVKPAAGSDHANRRFHRLGKSDPEGVAEQVINVFANHGFIYWGGYWDTPIDYQHFQTSREMAEFMAAASFAVARDFFEQYVKYYKACAQAYPWDYKARKIRDYTAWLKTEFKEKTLLEIYEKEPEALKEKMNQPVTVDPFCIQR